MTIDLRRLSDWPELGTAAARSALASAALIALCLPTWAQSSSTEPDRERLAREGRVIGSSRGAGQDPQTSVAQPDVSSRPSAVLSTSIRDALGAIRDPVGVVQALKSTGFDLSATFVGEGFATLAPGLRRGTSYLGRVDLQLNGDLEKLLAWRGATLHVSSYQIHGRGFSSAYIGNLLTVSSIEALPSFRLFELWVEQKLFKDQVGIKVGQLAADTEFAVSQTGTLFINSTFGWPNIFASNLPSGGPAYPLATPGVRVKYAPSRNISVQAGLYNGDPAGRSFSGVDPQRRNRAGTAFRVSDPAFVIAEAAYAYNLSAADEGEPGTVTLGGWHHLGRFSSLNVDQAGVSLADPSSSGLARRFRGNSGVYGMVDQTIYREPDDPNDGASVFARLSTSPGDRNLIDLYFDAGVAYKGLFPGRSDDTVGIAFASAHISASARKLDMDVILSAVPRPKRTSERAIEVTYQAVLGPGITLQPTFQYILRPGGGVVNPRNASGAPIGDTAIAGIRATIRY